MKKVVVYNNQNVVDIALQEYGKAESVKIILEDNEGVDFQTPYVTPGTVLNIRENLYELTEATPKNVELYLSKKHKPALGDHAPCGIDYMQLESTFVIGGSCGDHQNNPNAGSNQGLDFFALDNDFQLT